MNSAANENKHTILIVDDEAFNLDILETTLEEAGFAVTRAINGVEALDILNKSKQDLVVLDRMMPGMDGIAVLKAMKSNAQFHAIPVILQTADGQHEQMMEGIRAGAYYYLIKPYNEEVLLSIVKAALRDAKKLREIGDEARRHKNIIGLLEKARFRFRTFEESKHIAHYIASFCPNPEKVSFGLYELMVNAIEHGNLNVPYEKKYQLTVESRWNEEVQRLVALPENAQKYATLTFEITQDAYTITIKDQGKGFRWKDYLDFDPMRMTEPVGRGIPMTNAICFSTLEYVDNGTQAVCKILKH